MVFNAFFNVFNTFFEVLGDNFMTEAEQIKIVDMRRKGMGYKAIAAKLDVSRDTVRKFCKNNNLAGYAEAAKLNHDDMIADGSICQNCGKSIEQPKRGRPKRFCSDKCRLDWWNDNFSSHNFGTVTVCAGCGRSFTSSPSANRKYCSHECYIKSRFGGKDNDRTR